MWVVRHAAEDDVDADEEEDDDDFNDDDNGDTNDYDDDSEAGRVPGIGVRVVGPAGEQGGGL